MRNSELMIVNSDIPVRMDRYIRRVYPSVTQGVIEQALRTRKILLNGQKTSANTQVVNHDKISYTMGMFVDYSSIKTTNYPFSKSVSILAKKIFDEYLIFNSSEFIAIDKPSGLAVQGGSKILLSIDEALKYVNQTKNMHYKLVHRLDKDTSGILLIANGHINARKLGEAFKKHLVKKTYIAIVDQYPKKKKESLVHYIAKDRSKLFDTVKEVKLGGKKAETDYQVIGYLDNNKTIIQFKPKTGRMHQIRFHAKFLGCPIIGDKKYGGHKHSRMCLHSTKIEIDQSVFLKKIKIYAKLPQDFFTF